MKELKKEFMEKFGNEEIREWIEERMSKKRKKKEKPPFTIDYESFEYKLSKKFIDFHIENNSGGMVRIVKKYGIEIILENYIKTLKKLKKEYTEKQIDYIVNYTMKDNFWNNQIQSINKFIEKNKEGIPYFVVMIDKAKQEYQIKKQVENKINKLDLSQYRI